MSHLATDDRVLLKHGAGGRAMRRLIEEAFLQVFETDPPRRAGWSASPTWTTGAPSGLGIAGSSSRPIHTVQPTVFPGGDIGRLAVCGTVNDWR